MNVSQWRMKQIESGRLARPKFPEILTSQKKGWGRQVCVGLCLTLQNNKMGPIPPPPPITCILLSAITGNLRSVSIARKLKIKVCTNGNFVVVDS